VLADIRPALEAANTRKKLHLDVDLKTAPSVVRTSRKALSAIISNLALNAIKFTECGGVTIQVGQGAVDGIDGIEIEVSDTGPGLDQSALDEATQPFVQLSRSSTRSHRGLGLGLTIVRQYVNQLGGTLGLHSVQGQGATFTVRLPIPAERTQDRCTNALP
jgi:signal transduction histidine kinase